MGSQSRLAEHRNAVINQYLDRQVNELEFLRKLQIYELELAYYVDQEAVSRLEQSDNEQTLAFLLTEKEREAGGWGEIPKAEDVRA